MYLATSTSFSSFSILSLRAPIYISRTVTLCTLVWLLALAFTSSRDSNTYGAAAIVPKALAESMMLNSFCCKRKSPTPCLFHWSQGTRFSACWRCHSTRGQTEVLLDFRRRYQLYRTISVCVVSRLLRFASCLERKSRSLSKVEIVCSLIIRTLCRRCSDCLCQIICPLIIWISYHP